MKPKPLHIAAALLLTTSLAVAQSKPSTVPTKVIYVLCGTLYDGKSDGPQKNVMLRVSGEKIEAVGAAAPDAGAEVIDLSRQVRLPGMVDTHSHVLLQGDITADDYDVQLLKSSTPYRTILGTVSARRALEYGFTTIRDLETEGERVSHHGAVRDDSGAGAALGQHDGRRVAWHAGQDWLGGTWQVRRHRGRARRSAGGHPATREGELRDEGWRGVRNA